MWPRSLFTLGQPQTRRNKKSLHTYDVLHQVKAVDVRIISGFRPATNKKETPACAGELLAVVLNQNAKIHAVRIGGKAC